MRCPFQINGMPVRGHAFASKTLNDTEGLITLKIIRMTPGQNEHVRTEYEPTDVRYGTIKYYDTGVHVRTDFPRPQVSNGQMFSNFPYYGVQAPTTNFSNWQLPCV